MTPTNKRLLLGGALVLTLVATWFAPQEEVATAVVASPARAPRAATPAAADSSALDVLAIRKRDGADQEERDARLFNSTEWGAGAVPAAAAAAAAPAAAEPVAPQLPPLPFKVLGSQQQAGKTIVFLQQNDANHVVRVGDTIGETYRVERLEGGTLTLRYLPMDQVQTLEVGRTFEEEK